MIVFFFFLVSILVLLFSKNGLKHGTGELKENSGIILKGEWKFDKINGKG